MSLLAYHVLNGVRRNLSVISNV